MVARGLPDPYCRWVPPSEFAAMKKYDVTGVGLNLGTAEEYVKKTVRHHPGPLFVLAPGARTHPYLRHQPPSGCETLTTPPHPPPGP